MWKPRSKTKATTFGQTTWHGDTIEFTLTPCNDYEDLTLFIVKNQRGKIVITRTWTKPRPSYEPKESDESMIFPHPSSGSML